MNRAWGIISVICLGLSFGVIPAFAQTDNPIIFPTAFSESDRTGHSPDTFVFQFSRADPSNGAWQIRSDTDGCRILPRDIHPQSGVFTWQIPLLSEPTTCEVTVSRTGNDPTSRQFELHIYRTIVLPRVDITEGQVPPSLSTIIPNSNEGVPDSVSKYEITRPSGINIQRNEQVDLFAEMLASLDEETGDFSRSLACDAIRDGHEFADFDFLLRFEDSTDVTFGLGLMRISNAENCNQRPTFSPEYDADISVGDTIPSLADTVNNPDHPSDPISRYSIRDGDSEPSLPDYIVESLNPDTGEFAAPFLCDSIGSNVQREFSFDWIFADGTGEYTQPGMIRVTNGDACIVKDYVPELLEGQIPPPLSDSIPNFENSPDSATEYSIDQGNFPDPLPDYIVESLNPTTGEFTAPFACDTLPNSDGGSTSRVPFDWTFENSDVDSGTRLGSMTVLEDLNCNDIPTFTQYSSTVSEGVVPLSLSSAVINPDLVQGDPVSVYRIKSGDLPQSFIDSLNANSEFADHGTFDSFSFDTVSTQQGSRVFEFVWTFEDGTGESGNQNGILTVNNMNRAPTIDDPISNFPSFLRTNELVSFPLMGIDPDDDTLIWDISSPDLGASIDQDGIFSWTPLEQHVGMNEFTFTLTDSVLTAVPRSHTFDVRIPPTIVEYRETVSENGPIPSLSSVVTNPDANLADAPSIYRIKSGNLPESIMNSLIENNGRFDTTFPFNTTNNAQGSRVFEFVWTFEGNTGESGNQNGKITVTNFNRPPTIQPPSNNFQVHDVDQHITFNLTGHDPDTDTGTGTGDPPPIWDVSDTSSIDTGAIIHQNGTFSWTSDSRFDGEDPFRFTFTLTDVGNLQAETSVTVRITTDPIIAPDGSSTETEGNLVSTQFGEDGPGPRTCTTDSILPESLTLTVTNRSTKCILTGTLSLDAITNGLTSQEFPIVYITNTTGIFASGTHTLTVKELPLFDSYEETVAEGGTLPSLYSTVIDPDLIPETISGYTVRDGNLPPYITDLLNPVTGEFDGTIPFDAVTSTQGFVTFEFDWIFTDGIGSTGVQSGTITVTNANRPPTITTGPDDVGTTRDEHEMVEFTLMHEDLDTNVGDPRPVWDVSSDDTAANDNATITADGEFEWTPDDTHGGRTITITFTLDDSVSEPATQDIPFDVREVNAEPTAIRPYTFEVNEGGEISDSLVGLVDDADEMPPSNVTYTIISGTLPPGIMLEDDGTFSGTVLHNATTIADPSEPFVFQWQYHDGSNTRDEMGTIEVANVNRPPTITTGPDDVGTTRDEHEMVEFTLMHEDLDTNVGDPRPVWDVSSDDTAANDNATITADGEFEWTPDDTHGGRTITITFTLDDSVSEPATQDIPFDVREVNAEPTAIRPYTFEVNEGGEISDSLVGLVDDADEMPPSNVTYTIISGTLPPGIMLEDDGTFSGTVLHNATTIADPSEPFVFQWQYHDGQNDIDDTGTITVTNVNRPPTITTGPDDVGTTRDEHEMVEFTLMHEDLDTNVGDPRPVWDVSSDDTAANDNATITADGEFEWTPDDTHGGRTITITFTLDDSVSEPATQDIPFDVREVNAEPTAIRPYTFEVNEGGEISDSLVGLVDDADEMPPSNVTYTIISGTLPPGIMLEDDGTFSGTVLHNATTIADPSEPFVFQWQYHDGSNTRDEMGTIEVANVNRPPTITTGPDDVGTTRDEHEMVEFTLMHEDLDTNVGDPRPVWDVSSDDTAANDNATITADGEFEWTPDDTHGGRTITITFTLDDSVSEPATQDIPFDVREVNAEPTAIRPYTFEVNEGGEISDSLVGLVDDADEMPPSNVTYTIISGTLPPGIMLEDDGTFSGTVLHNATTIADPSEPFVFQWQYHDGQNDIDDTGTITVTNANRPPTITTGPDDVGTTRDEHEMVEFTLMHEDLDTNVGDPRPVWDVSSDDTAANANATITADGEFEWTPDDTHGGRTITITFTLDDSVSEPATQDIPFDVREVNAEPTAIRPYTFEVNEGGEISDSLVGLVDDADEMPPSNVTYTIISGTLPPGIMLEDDGIFSGTVLHNATTIADPSEPFVFQWQYHDGQNDIDDTGTITVTNANRPPTITTGPDDVGTTRDEHEMVEFTLMHEDLDTNVGDPRPVWDVSSDDTAANANATITADGEFEWTPDDTHGGRTITITFTLDDSVSEPATQDIPFDVREVNAEPTAIRPYTFEVNEGGEISDSLVGLVDDADEMPPSNVTYTIISGTLPPGIMLEDDGIFSGTVLHNATTIADPSEPFVFQWQYHDGQNDIDDTGTITVTNVNRPPTITTGPDDVGTTRDEHEMVEFTLMHEDLDTNVGDPRPVWDVSSDDTAANANATITADGEFEWTPDDTHGGRTITITFTLDDSVSEPATQDIPFDVREVNAEPTAIRPYTFEVNEGGEISDSLVGLVDDADEMPPSNVTYTIISGTLPPGIMLEDDGTFSGTVLHNATTIADPSEPFVFQWQYHDGQNDIDDTGTITVTNVNRPPTITTGPDDVGTTRDEHEMVEFTLMHEDLDTNVGDPRPVWDVSSDDTAANDNATITADGEFEWTPDDTHGGRTITITFTLDDSVSEPATQDIPFDVREVNAEPTAIRPYTFEVNEGGEISDSLVGLVDDADEMPPSNVTYTIISGTLPPGIMLEDDGTFSGTVLHNATTIADPSEPFVFQWQYHDGQNDIDDTGTITVTNVNRPPTITTGPDDVGTTRDEHEMVEFTLMHEDLDTNVGDPRPVWDVSSDDTAANDNATITADGEFEWTPDDTHGGRTITITFTLDDSVSEPATQDIPFDVREVNAEPTAIRPYTFEVNEGGEISDSLVGLVDDADEMPPSNVTYTIISGTLPPGIMLEDDGTFSGTVLHNATTIADPSEPFVFQWQYHDGSNTRDEMGTIEVANVNRPPTITTGPDDVGTTRDEHEMVEFTLMHEDLDTNVGDPRPVWDVSSDDTAANANATITADGEFEWTPDDTHGGRTITITFTLDDSVSEPATQDIPFDVREVNAEPTAIRPYTFEVNEGGEISDSLVGLVDDADEMPPSNVTYTIISGTLPPGIMLEDDGIFSGTVLHNATTIADPSEPFVFQWQYHDGQNDIDDTGTITVTNVNRPPTITTGPDDVGTTRDEHEMVEFTLMHEDLDTNVGDPRPVWDVSSDDTAANANATITADGEFEWTPDDTHGGRTITITFTLDDSVSEPATQDIPFDVTEVNIRPTLSELYFVNVTEGGEISRSLSDVIVDPEETPTTVMTYTLAGDRALPPGIMLNSDGSFLGTVSRDATTATDSPQIYEFDWTYDDGTIPPFSSTGMINVTNANQLPIINPITGINTEPHVGETVEYNLRGTDLDRDALIWGISSPDLGATIDQDGMFSWTPREEHAGVQVLTFTLTDSIDLPVTAPVTFTVNPNNLPTFTSYTQTVSEGQTPLSLSSAVTNPEESVFDLVSTYEIIPGVLPDSIMNSLYPNNGSFDSPVPFETLPAGTDSMTYEFQWTFTDGTGPSGNQDGTLTVTNQNVSPMINPIQSFPSILLINELVSFALRGSDPDGDEIMWSLSQPNHGAHITPEGDFSWIPREEHLGIQEFTFTLIDIHDEPAMALTRAFNVVEFNLVLQESDSGFEFPSGQSTEHLLLLADTDLNTMNLDWEIRSVFQSGSMVDNPGITLESGDVTGLNGEILYTTNGFLTWNPLHDLIGESYQVQVRAADGTSDTTQVGIVDVVVVDNIDPVITFTSLLTTSDSAGTTADFVEVSDNNPNDDFVDEPTTDDPNPEPRFTCVRDDDTPIANGDLLAIDSHAITCTATDLSGNQAELTQTVIVDYDADALSAIGSYAETVPEGSFIPPLSSVVTVPSRDLPASVSIYRIESDDLPEDIISSLNNQTGAFSAQFSCNAVLAGEDPVTFSFTFTFEDDIVKSDPQDGTITVSHNPRCGLGSGSTNDWKKKPTFGMSWEVSSDQLVDGGFIFNGYTLDITDNWHTDFTRTSSIIGEINSVTLKAYAADGFRYVVLSLGVPEIGMAPDAETDIILMLNRNYTNPDDYDIVEIIHEQKESLIDESRTAATVKRVLCNADSETVCHSFDISFKVDAPLKSDVLAISAVDSKRRSTVTFINEGIEFTGQPILAPNTHSIVQKKTNQGPTEIIALTQQDRRYNIWEDDSGYLWFQNDHGSWFSITAPETERFTDSAVHVMTRLHSNFGNLMQHEREKAALIFDASKLISVPDHAFSHDYSDVQYGVTKFEKLADELHIEQGKAQRIMELLR